MVKKGFVFLIALLLVMHFTIILVYAEKLGIEAKDSYLPGEEVRFKVVLYDDENNKIQGQVNYELLNYYKELVIGGIAESGQEVIYKLPTNTPQLPWEIDANYKDISTNIKFNVAELEKAEISLEGDVLVIKNIGNVPYDRNILIYIGNNDQTAKVYLELDQTKRIRLTAPTGQYDVRVIEGNEGNTLEFKNVGLTGNVIGLESVLGQQNFWRKYPAVGLFLGALLLVIVIVIGLKFYNKNSE